MTPVWRTRQASPTDASRLADAHILSFPRSWTATEFAQLLRMPHIFAVLAEADPIDDGLAEVMGFLMYCVAADETEILTLCVHPDRRREGLASVLLEAALADAVNRGTRRMFLEVAVTNTGARAFYERRGFAQRTMRKGYYADGGDALVLTRDLAAR
ncbi:MAG: GNAT family N-acetyltransferase [Maricaulaceae bacterium]